MSYSWTSILKFWEVYNVDGVAVSDTDAKSNLVFWRDATGVIEIVGRFSVIDIPILDKDFDWFNVSFGNEFCSWLKSSLDCDC